MNNLPEHNIDSSMQALEEYKEVDKDATLHSFLLFMCIAKGPGTMPVTDLVLRSKMTKTTVSRMLSIMSSAGRADKEGLHLLTVDDSSTDRRCKEVNLTDKGRALIEKMFLPISKGPVWSVPYMELKTVLDFCIQEDISQNSPVMKKWVHRVSASSTHTTFTLSFEDVTALKTITDVINRDSMGDIMASVIASLRHTYR